VKYMERRAIFGATVMDAVSTSLAERPIAATRPPPTAVGARSRDATPEGA
jgi:hypothetical protein